MGQNTKSLPNLKNAVMRTLLQKAFMLTTKNKRKFILNDCVRILQTCRISTNYKMGITLLIECHFLLKYSNVYLLKNLGASVKFKDVKNQMKLKIFYLEFSLPVILLRRNFNSQMQRKWVRGQYKWLINLINSLPWVLINIVITITLLYIVKYRLTIIYSLLISASVNGPVYSLKRCQPG